MASVGATVLVLGLATVAQAQQTCDINRLVAPLNAACCPRPTACSGGIPKVCTAACRAAWGDFSSSPCRAQVLSATGADATSQRLAGIFAAVSQLCDDNDVGTAGMCRPDGSMCPILIDVRTEDEWNGGHASCATRVPVQDDPSLVAQIVDLANGDMATPIVTYCYSGGRAGRAETVISDAGFEDVTNGGGFIMPAGNAAVLEEMCTCNTPCASSCPSLGAPAGTTGECRDLNVGATCDFACDPAGQTGHRRTQAGTVPHGRPVGDSVATFRCAHGRAGPEWTQIADCAAGATAAVGLDPNDSTRFVLNNGQTMPAVSFGFEIYGDDTAEQLMGVALDQGVRNFFASVLANNQPGVARKLATMEREHGVTREEIFLCGSVTQCRTGMDDRACYEYTANMAAANLHDLGVDYLDQIMLDYPPSPSCDANTCMLIKAQWRAFTDMLERGETLGIAVSNYCPCHLDCIIDDPDLTVVPVVNQLKYHIGMGADPHDMIADNYARGVVPQAYSPLAHGSLARSADVDTVKPHYRGKSTAQIAYKWVLQHEVSVCMSADDSDHRVTQEFQEDMDMFDWTISDADMSTLNDIGPARPRFPETPASCYSSGSGR